MTYYSSSLAGLNVLDLPMGETAMGIDKNTPPLPELTLKFRGIFDKELPRNGPEISANSAFV